MSAREQLRQADGAEFRDAEGKTRRLSLLPGLSEQELHELSGRIPCPIPPAIHDLLRFTRGLATGPLEAVDFSGLGGFEFPELFPWGLPIARDGRGNHWIVDLGEESSDWGPVFFLSQDPPVVLLQSESFDGFVEELLKLARAPEQSFLQVVRERLAGEVFRNEVPAVPSDDLARSHDPVLHGFANRLPSDHDIIDLRGAAPGQGFVWGKYGPTPNLARCLGQRVFARDRRPNQLLDRLDRFLIR